MEAPERTFDARRANHLRAELKLERGPFKQRKLVRLLSELDDPIAADALIWALANKKTEFVRSEAADALATYRSEECRAALLAAVLTDSSTDVIRHATNALVGYELSRAEIESIVPASLAGDKYQRVALADLLAAQSDDVAVQPLLGLLEDSNFLVRMTSFTALNAREDPTLFPALHRAAEKEGTVMRKVLHGTAELPPEVQDE
jgi:HEAT repeat protein